MLLRAANWMLLVLNAGFTGINLYQHHWSAASMGFAAVTMMTFCAWTLSQANYMLKDARQKWQESAELLRACDEHERRCR